MDQTFDHQHHYLKAVDNDNNIAAVLPLYEMNSRLFGHFAISLPYVNYGGVLTDNEHAGQAILEYCEKLGQELKFTHILFREYENKIYDWSCEQHKVTMLLELPKSAEMLWKQIGSKRRAQVKRPEREGSKVRIGKIEMLNDFYKIFSRNMRDLGTPVYSKSWFRNILTVFYNETFIVLIYLKDRPVAAGFLIKHGARMEIPWASSLKEANRYGVNMLLYWEVLKHSISLGCDVFDFGRSSKDANTYRFKKQWGGTPKQLYWYIWTRDGKEAPRLDPNNKKYTQAIKLWKKLPLPVANAFGPGIVKFLP
jgi:FemAB-related protein (PEP-CTERM system-associated)